MVWPTACLRPMNPTSSFGHASETPAPSERERVNGGTSTHWGGQSRQLDRISFKKRPGFPGWPIDRADLDPDHAQAAAFCKLHGDDFTAGYWAKILQAEVPHLTGFDAEMYQFVGRDYKNFATRTFDGITIGQSPVDVILNASLLHIDHSNGVVSGLRVASMDDRSPPRKSTEFTVQADVHVLACGAVANAWQLLLSNAGNEHDQVGRDFMCHPLSKNRVVTITRPDLSNAESRLMSGQTPNGVGCRDPNGVGVTGRFSPNAEQQEKLGIGSCWFWAGGGQYYFEMAPNPDSRGHPRRHARPGLWPAGSPGNHAPGRGDL
jgi:hypothetical protein